MYKQIFFTTTLAILLSVMTAKAQSVTSPDGDIKVTLELTNQGKPQYSVNYEGQEMLKPSALGLTTNIGDYTQGLTLKGVVTNPVSDTYSLRNIKQSHVAYQANEAVATYEKDGRTVMDIIFRVSNRDVAFCYRLYPKKDTRVCVVESEASSFVLPDGTTTFLCPQSKPMGGFARTSPSYETPYTLDDAIGKNGSLRLCVASQGV